MRLDLGKGGESLTWYCRFQGKVLIIPGVDGAAGVNRRDGRELQLYGIVTGSCKKR